MSNTENAIDEVVEFFQSDEAVPAISVIFIVLLGFVSDIDYFLIETGTMLIFYAVLVRMWTAMSPDDSELLRGDFSHLLFLLMSAGAVSIGIMIEEWLNSLSGSLLPAQFLALSVIISRVYLHIRDSASMKRILLLDTAHDRYVVLVPWSVVFILPLIIDANLLVAQTTGAFVNLTLLGILIGTASYLYFEEEVGQ